MREELVGRVGSPLHQLQYTAADGRQSVQQREGRGVQREDSAAMQGRCEGDHGVARNEASSDRTGQGVGAEGGAMGD